MAKFVSRKRSRSSSNRAVARTVRRVLAKHERTAAMWHPMYTWHCEVQSFPPGTPCPNGAQIALWDPVTDATAGGSGTAGIEGKLIERITGDLYFKPIFVGLPSLGDVFNAYAGMNTLLRVGLMKQRSEVKESYTEVFVTWNPLDGVHDPSSTLNEGDWTQGRWVRQWEHQFASTNELEQGFQAVDCCSNTTRAQYDVPALSGTSPGATSQSSYRKRKENH